jgi:hypothetical protein
MKNLNDQIEKLKTKVEQLRNAPISDRIKDKDFIKNVKLLQSLEREKQQREKITEANKNIQIYNSDIDFICVIFDKIKDIDITTNNGLINKRFLNKIPELKDIYIKLEYKKNQLESIKLNRNTFYFNSLELSDFIKMYPKRYLLDYDKFIKEFESYEKLKNEFEQIKNKYESDIKFMYEYEYNNIVNRQTQTIYEYY